MRLFTQDTKVEALKRAPLFAGLSRKELVQLARVSDDLEVPPGKVLCKEGQVGREFFVIVDRRPRTSNSPTKARSLGGRRSASRTDSDTRTECRAALVISWRRAAVFTVSP